MFKYAIKRVVVFKKLSVSTVARPMLYYIIYIYTILADSMHIRIILKKLNLQQYFGNSIYKVNKLTTHI